MNLAKVPELHTIILYTVDAEVRMKLIALVCLILFIAHSALSADCAGRLNPKAQFTTPVLRADINLLVNGEPHVATLEAHTGINNNKAHGSVTTVFMDPVVVLNIGQKNYRMKILNEPETLQALAKQFGNLGIIRRVAIDDAPDTKLVRNFIYNNFFNPEPLVTFEKRDDGQTYLRALLNARDYKERFGIRIQDSFRLWGTDNTVSGVSFILKK